ncbi:rod shape-determining protein RodA [Immundisolibacter sp.]
MSAWLAVWRRITVDWALLLGLLGLCAAGLLLAYSASGESVQAVQSQGARVTLSLLLLLLAAQVPVGWLQRLAAPFYLLTIILLIVVDAIGAIGHGAQRWMELGPLRFQPSELAKLAVPMMVARYLSDRALPPTARDVTTSAALALLPVLLIAAQPDLGTALLVAAAGLSVLFLAGLSWRVIGLFVGLAAASAPLLWLFGMHDYQRQRVLTLFDPQRDPLGAGYHIIQSTIAIGSGGFYGKGWLEGTQTRLRFLPESATDFVFAVFGEEFGLLGAIGLLLVYGFIIGRGMYIASQASDGFGRLLGGGLVCTFFVYVLVNIGMVSGLLPVVGVPLPLVSYGGTSMVTLMLGFGMLMGIRAHRKLWPA